jgi:hypothetical protein
MISIGTQDSFFFLSGPQSLASLSQCHLLRRRSDGKDFSFTVSGRSNGAFITHNEFFTYQVFMLTTAVAFVGFLEALKLTLFGI